MTRSIEDMERSHFNLNDLSQVDIDFDTLTQNTIDLKISGKIQYDKDFLSLMKLARKAKSPFIKSTTEFDKYYETQIYPDAKKLAKKYKITVRKVTEFILDTLIDEDPKYIKRIPRKS